MSVYSDNRPQDIPTVHPFVTFCEKLDALYRRYDRSEFDAAEIVRHYEDLANIIDGSLSIGPTGQSAESVASLDQMEHPNQRVADRSLRFMCANLTCRYEVDPSDIRCRRTTRKDRD